MRIPSFGVFNSKIPSKGPQVMPLNLDFTISSTVAIDLLLEQFLTVLEMIQGVFVDNRNNDQPIEIELLGGQQVLVLGPGKQGYFPIFVQNPPKMTCRSGGGVVVPIIFYNMPLPASSWNSGETADFSFDVNGYLQVSDPALDAIITDLGQGPALPVNIYSGLSGAPSDSIANPSLVAFMANLQMQWTNTAWERTRSNFGGSAIASASRASGTVTNSLDLINNNGRALNIITNISAGAGTVTVKAQTKDPVSGLYVDIPGAVTAALTGVGTYIMQIGPGLTTIANVSIPALIGRTIRVTQTTGGGVNITNSVGYEIIY